MAPIQNHPGAPSERTQAQPTPGESLRVEGPQAPEVHLGQVGCVPGSASPTPGCSSAEGPQTQGWCCWKVGPGPQCQNNNEDTILRKRRVLLFC